MDTDEKILKTKELEVMFMEGLIEDYATVVDENEDEDWIQVEGTWIPFSSYENYSNWSDKHDV